MMQNCNETRIQQFLAYDLSIDEQRDLEQHLSTCHACRQRLQVSTADATWWQDASDFLPDQNHDLLSLTQVCSDTDINSKQQQASLSDSPNAASMSGSIRNVIQLLGPTDDPRMLGRIGSYEVAGVVGAGGMSVVLKAFDRSLNRFVAVKVLAPHLATTGAARTRFAREAQAAAAIVHENVIAIHGVDEAQGLPYLVMPYWKGDSLQNRIDRDGPLTIKEILRVSTQTAHGLAAAHAQGLVHRDVKPANILLGVGVERVTITDFGLARAADDASLTRSGTIAGTPQYMSPEQARGETIDQRSDLFSLGSVIYAMCTGRAPFRADSSFGVLRRITDSQPRSIRDINSDIPGWFCRLVERLHAKDAERRYASAAEVARDLEQCLAHVQQPSRESLPSGLETPLTVRLRRHWPLAAVAIVGALLLAPAVAYLIAPEQTPKTTLHGIPANSRKTTQETNDVALPPEPAVHAENPPGDFRWRDGTEEDLLEFERDISRAEEELDSLIP